MSLVFGKAKEKLSRRRFLQGTGGTIALPLLAGAAGSVSAQSSDVPERVIGLFVAMGLPQEITGEGFRYEFSGVAPFESLQPYEDKFAIVRGLEVKSDGPKENNHTRGCASYLCGHDYNNFSSKGGRTLDWMIKESLNIDTTIPTINTGIWGADNASQRMRMVHSWRDVNRPNEPIPDPRRLFNLMFGGATNSNSSPSQVDKKAEYRKSVLDTVVEEYKRVVSPASGFSSDVRNVISNHLDTVREIEVRVGKVDDMMTGGMSQCEKSDEPRSYNSNGRYPANINDWPDLWDLVTDLFVQAYRCDLTRIGTMMVDSGGNDFQFQGVHGNSHSHHEHLHNWKNNRAFSMEIWKYLYDYAGAFVKKLDSKDYVDADGGTLLDNSTVIMGTELGDPWHKLEDMTFMIGGGKGRFKSGVQTFSNRTDVDLYNTILSGLNISEFIGERKYYTENLDSILS